MLAPTFIESSHLKILINIGCMMDIPTGGYITGKYGESILNGGLGMLTGITGIGNSFKSTVMHYMTLSAMEKIYAVSDTYISTYDTEVNIHRNRLLTFTQNFERLKNVDLFDSGNWKISDKTVCYGNQWWSDYRQYLQNIYKEKDKLIKETPFLSKDKKTRHSLIIPTFTQVDSFSEFDTEDISKNYDEFELGESGGNTVYMRQGLAKLRFLNELPTLCGRANNYMLLTAHLGQVMHIASGPFSLPPPKKLSSMRNNDKIKGVTDKFFFYMSNLWQIYDVRPFQNKDTKGPEYPISPDNIQPNSTDLNIMTLKLLRSKSGASNVTFEILLSQNEGVLPSLSEFHFIKNCDRFGLTGNNINYKLDLFPDLNLTRTTIRSKLDNNPTLRRAVNITSELCQLITNHGKLDPKYICTPKQLYDDIKELGYDWSILLNTRGYWLFENEKHDLPFLSTMDLLKMRAQKYVSSGVFSEEETYHPYWLDADKKSIINPSI